jgi:hypothetical protein
MAEHQAPNGQRRATRNVVIAGSIFGFVLAIVVLVATLWLMPHGSLTRNASDQPSAPAASDRTVGQSAPTGGDNTGTSGDATRLGSGPAGSGRGSPAGSSGNVTGSTPAESGPRNDAPGTGTR